MAIELTCPRGHNLTIADAWAGRSGRCPVCKSPVQVPAPAHAVTAVQSLASSQASPQEAPRPPEIHDTPASAHSSIEVAPPAIATVCVPTVSALAAVGEVTSSTPKGPPPLPALVRATQPAIPVAKAPPPAAIGGLPTPIEAQHALSEPAAVPPLPVVVATSVIAASRPSAEPPRAVNGLSRLAPPLTPQQINDAVIANFAAARERTQAVPEVRPDSGPSVAVAAIEADSALHASAPSVGTPSEPAKRQTTTGYQPDADKCSTVYYLAAAMAALSLYCIAPAVSHLNLGAAPNWARVVVLLSLLQLAYAVWLASIPDWSTLRSSMVIFTVVAALYGLTMTVALSTPAENPLPLDLTEVRRQAVLWCAGVVLLASLLAYGCGRAAWRWRRTLESFSARASRRAAV